MREDRPRFPPTRAQQREVLDAFLRACAEGDLERLVTLLDPDGAWRADGGTVRAKPLRAAAPPGSPPCLSPSRAVRPCS